ncbi:MAG: nitrogen fixation negative regulator NifL [Rhodospirillaceae bacterium]|nr:nitrogen fixation negative regulator NifL [Rhodospirillaceae bacterium]
MPHDKAKAGTMPTQKPRDSAHSLGVEGAFVKGEEALGRAANPTCPNLPQGLFFDAVESLVSGISVADSTGKILYVNPAFQQITGYAAHDVVGRNHSLLSNKKTPARVYDDMWHTIVAGKVWTGRLLNRRKDGTPYLADLKVVPVPGGGDSPTHFLGIQRDVSTEMGLERHVAAQKALIENIIDVAPVVMALLNEHGKVLIDNHAYKILMADMDGQEPAWAFLKAVSGDEASQFLLERRECDSAEVKIEVGRRLGPRWFTCSGLWIDVARADVDSFYEPSPRRALLLVCLDVTARMRAFQQAKTSAIRALTAEIQQAQGMREVLQGAVYQLQGPLNMLDAVTAMMERGGGINPALASVLSDVQSAGTETLTRLRESVPQCLAEPVLPLNINELVREVMDFSIDRVLAEGVALSWLPTSILPAVSGRAGQLRTLIKVLLDNAVDAVAEPGVVTRGVVIETRRTAGGGVEVVISDSGFGVDASDKARIFEPFFSAWKRWRGRPGMGLAIAQNILTEHGGTVAVQTTGEGGCRMVVGLPAEDEAIITRGDGV